MASFSLDTTTIRQAQALCPEAIALRQYIEKAPGAELPIWVHKAGLRPRLREGVICLSSWRVTEDEDRPDRVFVPIHLRVPLIQRLHADCFSGHMGKKKTLARLKTRYLWGTMPKDVDKVTKTCVQCWRQTKEGARKKKAIGTLPKGWPGEVVAMDLFGPLPRTARGATIILVMMDHFTRWAEPVALRKAEVSDVVACLLEVWMPRHGVPAVLLSDNGPQFASTVLKEFCARIGVRKLYSTPYHPQGNSVVESYMRTLKKGLAALVSEDGKDWDLFLPAVAMAHNATPHIATGYSPFFLTQGREAPLPVQRHLEEPRLDATSHRWLSRLWRSRILAYEAQMEVERKRRKLTQDPNNILPPGTMVMMELTPKEKGKYPGKFVPSYKGPWVVLGSFQNGTTYKVREVATGKEQQLTRDQFKVVEPPARVLPRQEEPQGDEARPRDLEELDPEDEDELMVFLGSSETSEVSEEEEPSGAIPVEGRNIGNMGANPQQETRYNLRSPTRKRAPPKDP